jgi:hypothetical protein
MKWDGQRGIADSKFRADESGLGIDVTACWD